jgi:type I restriction enzyme S subunit
MTVETFMAIFGYLADAPNGVQKLRELFLQLAVQGKLVPQDSNDETASKLLTHIQTGKEGLIAEGKIKKPKPLQAISVDEKIFELPIGWEWARLDSISLKITDGEHISPQKTQAGMKLLTAKHVLDNGITLDDPQYVSLADGIRFRERCDPRSGDVLICSRGTIGRCCAIEVNEVFCLMGSVILVRAFEQIDPRYLSYYLKSEAGQFFIRGATKGMAVNALYLKDIRLCPISIPPCSEQKRIVAKVDQLMALCSELEARQQKQQQGRVRFNNASLNALITARKPGEFADHWQRICTNFDLLYDHPDTISKLRAVILQLAVQGKLVPQDPNDEPASVLLESIKAEKEGLVKEGKLKKQKALPEIDDSLAPFELPFRWAWARFPEVGEFGRGKSKHRPRNDPSLYSSGTYPMVQTGDVARANGEVRTYTALYNDAGLEQSKMWPKGTMCITIAANIADSAVLGFDACFPDSVVGLIASEEIGDVQYFEYFIRTTKEHLMDFAPSTAQKNINIGILEMVYIPLPPLAEMKRIVAKVDQLMALCDELEAKLNNTQQQSEKLMEATVRELLVA